MNTLHLSWFFIILLGFMSCSATKELPQKRQVNRTKKPANSESTATLLRIAAQNKGVKYHYGGETPRKGFDCSGLMLYMYKHIDVQLPHSANMQSKLGKKVDLDKAKVGDLIFFRNKGKISHVAMVYELKGDKIIMAHSSSSKGVIFEDLEQSKYWKKRFAFVKRII